MNRLCFNLFLTFAFTVLAGVRTVGAACLGDCNGDREVTVDEIILGVNIALENSSLNACPGFDSDEDGAVTINELIVAVTIALNACPPEFPTATPTDVLSETATPTLTPTQVPTDVPSATPSNAPATATATNTTAAATATFTQVPTATPTPTVALPTPTATATTVSNAVCGNLAVEAGETCDDGNAVTNPPSDTCPADCSIITCTPSGTKLDVAVSFTPPAGRNVAAMTVLLEYRDGRLQIPGIGDDVSSSVLNTPNGFLASSFDYNYALVVGIAGTRALTVGKIFDVRFDTCLNGPAPQASDLVCRVTEASGTNFQPVPGVTCSATLP